MQPCTSVPHPNDRRDADLALRLAQRAFAALIDDPGARAGGAFHQARLRSAARRTLSALSADDQARLQRWLALQLGSRAAAGNPLSRVDAMLAANVGAALPRVREDLAARRGDAAAA